MSSNCKAYVGGLLTGLVVVSVAAMVGMGQPGTGADLRVTASGDGRTAYLWSVGGSGLKFVASARAPKGQGDEDEKAKGEEHGKDADHGKPDDKGKGKGKG